MTATLNTYLQRTQLFLSDVRQELLNPDDLRAYINEARQEVALRAECVRRLPPISAAISSITITDPGSGYTAPTVTISAPDSASGKLPNPQGAQATAIATQIGGAIAAINLTYGGDGYFQPVVTIDDPTGTGATAVANVSGINTLNAGQEEYPFNRVDLSSFPGVASVFAVRSIAVIFSNYRFTLQVQSFSMHQSLVRNYVVSQYQYVPAFATQYGRGVAGSLYVYPPPNDTYQWEWDCLCLPDDLQTDLSPEAIPEPWTTCVPYFAAALAFQGIQNLNSARAYYDLFDRRMLRFGAKVLPGRAITYYGRP